MRLKVGAMVWLLGLLLYFAPAQTHGQVITEGPDSVRVPLAAADTVGKRGFFLSEWDKPAKAALLSAIIPGAGQIYNKAYWKVPIIYATGGVLAYFYIENNNNYQTYRKAYLLRRDGDPTTRDEFADDLYLGENSSNGESLLKFRRDGWRRYRDLTIIISVAAYTLQIAEAYVHAHLKEFDVSDELTLRVQPNLVPLRSQPGNLAPGLTLTLYTRSK
ncbi:DUF5683 domain-containing protein [Pontibacter mangrovi]|uniref:DUF5683 domain-containing protein n=1 Tax=Pontibacter mangrovi TaxID=2589816 RepID=A0A501WGD8_9BACT|nr:DUF5683 domain-containing protein [Pontibacter mangrovi]TPE46067.1 hypothetical protein FJM65_01605 [Pontibacter mangrovi]